MVPRNQVARLYGADVPYLDVCWHCCFELPQPRMRAMPLFYLGIIACKAMISKWNNRLDLTLTPNGPPAKLPAMFNVSDFGNEWA